MTESKNINTESDFKERTGLIIRISNKRMVKRLMKFGLLHYFSSKMSYAILYVHTDNLEKTISKIKKEKYVNSVEQSELRDLPIEYEGVLEKLNKEINKTKKKEGNDLFSGRFDF